MRGALIVGHLRATANYSRRANSAVITVVVKRVPGWLAMCSIGEHDVNGYVVQMPRDRQLNQSGPTAEVVRRGLAPAIAYPAPVVLVVSFMALLCSNPRSSSSSTVLACARGGALSAAPRP
jgi:hypothetical protein